MTVHTQLSAEIARQLAPKLRPRYLALTTERFVYEEPDSVAVSAASLYPDAGVTGVDPTAKAEGKTGISTAPLRLETVMPTAVPHVTVEIKDTANRQLVTAIEVLSPSSKQAGGRDEYLRKRRRILISTAHLMEIDLLRKGQRVPMKAPLPPAPYFVVLSRAESRPLSDVWPVSLTEPLPVVPVPLLPEDADVELDLQAALQNVYDLVGYDLAVDYTQPPEIPFESEEDAAWIGKRLAK